MSAGTVGRKGSGRKGPSLFQTLVEQGSSGGVMLEGADWERVHSSTAKSIHWKATCNVYSTDRMFKLFEGSEERECGTAVGSIVKRTFRATEFTAIKPRLLIPTRKPHEDEVSVEPTPVAAEKIEPTEKQRGNEEQESEKDHYPGPYGDNLNQQMDHAAVLQEEESSGEKRLVIVSNEDEEVVNEEGKYSREWILGLGRGPLALLPPPSVPFLLRAFPHLLRPIPGHAALRKGRHHL